MLLPLYLILGEIYPTEPPSPPYFIYGEICPKETICNLSVGEKK